MKEKIKRIPLCVMICILAGSLAAAPVNAKVEPVELSFLSGGTGGTYYPVAGFLSSLIQKECPLVKSASAAVTAASLENVRLLQAGKGMISVVNAQMAYQGSRGIGKFKKVQDKVRSLCWAHAAMKHWIVRKDSGIKSIRDCRGKRVSTGAPGSGTMTSNRQILEFFGLTPKDFDERFLSYRESAEALKAGRIDVIAGIGNMVPAAIITELASSMPIDLISTPIEDLKAISKKFPYYRWGKIPAGTYKGIDHDVYTQDSNTLIMVSSDLNEDIVYQIIKAIYEKKDWLMKYGHKSIRSWRWNDVSVGEIAPIHPGAIRYYKEIGIMK